MRWLITGAGGQLGVDLQRVLTPAAQAGTDQVLALSRRELDIADPTAVEACLTAFRPDLVLNAAAYTAVDRAEEEIAAAFRANATGPQVLADGIARHGGRLLHVSTDYVFNGHARTPYATDAPTDPQSVYGRSKLAGEQAVRVALPDRSWVVRTAWVYGVDGANFVKTMVRLAAERQTVSVVTDQRGSPTWSADLARGLVALASAPGSAGVYHCTNSGDTTWYEFTQAIFEELGADPGRVLPTTTGEFPRPAPRPAYSVLSDHAWHAAGLAPLRHWRAALSAAFDVAGERFRPRT